MLEFSLPTWSAGHEMKRLVRKGVPIKTPTYTVDGHLVWGATARIVESLLERLGAAAERRAPGAYVLLDRHVDQVAPLGPRAVVVLDVVLAEQLVQHEPGVRRALADPAVGDDRVVAVDHALAGVELAQLVGGLEGAVLLHRLRPRDRGRAGDVAGALRALLLVAGHRDQLARELLRRAHVDEPGARVERRAAPRRAWRGSRRRPAARVNCCALVARHVGAGRPALGDPLLARAVHQLHVVVAVVLQVPVRVGREPVVAVAVEHDRVVVGDAAAAEQLAELLRAEEVALDLVLEVLLPVEADRAGDVRLGVERGVLVDLDDPDRVVVQVILDPLRVDQDVLRVVGHESSSFESDKASRN